MRAFKGQHLTAVPKVDRVKHDRRVAVRSVTCPTCQAGVGDPCVNAAGAPTMQHKYRRVMALRAERGE